VRRELTLVARIRKTMEIAMTLRFVGIDPNTTGDHCPAVFVDDASGDLVFQGTTVTDTAELTSVAEHSPIAPYESIVRIPARMRHIVMEALSGSGTAVQ
jgi:hypothetical protein